MPDFLKKVAESAATIHPVWMLVDMLVAVFLGGTVAWIYSKTRPRSQVSPSFSATLVLLSGLIAMVTQVVGNEIARAFSLVGALSIVRFRTVVRDTQDTAFVIFAVVLGMAIGAHNYWIAGIGLGVVGGSAAILARSRRLPGAQEPFQLAIRIGLGKDIDELLDKTLSEYLYDKRLVSISTAKHGMMIDITYEARLKQDDIADELVNALNKLDGVQSVELKRHTDTDEQQQT